MKFIVPLGLLLLFTISCKKEQYFYVEGFAQGTTYHITYEGKKDYSGEFKHILDSFDMSLSSYIDSSIISRFNRNDSTVVADSFFTEVYRKSYEVYRNTDGMFDITVGPLVKAWGFLKDTSIHPNAEKINELLSHIGMDKTSLVNGKLVKTDPQIIMDVNAIAQGYSVDVVSEFLERNGVFNYLVEIGGELRTKGVNAKGSIWKVGIDKPIDGNEIAGENIQTIIQITGKSMATSGNYRKFYVENDQKFSHTINPKTGYPARNNLLSATIIANDCITADGYATACMVGGLEKSKELLSKMKDMYGYLIYNDSTGTFKIFCSDSIKSMILPDK